MARRYKLDIQNKRFGYLTALEVDLSKPSGGSKPTYWFCKCVCGRIISIARKHLIRSITKSCGCKRNVGLPDGESLVNTVYAGYKAGASKRDYAFELTKEAIRGLIFNNCYYCGSKPTTRRKLTRYKSQIYYNGIDRVDNSKGYIEGNMVTCCRKCNGMKEKYSTTEFLEHIDKIYEYQRHKNDT